MRVLWTRHCLVSLVGAIFLCNFALAQQQPNDLRRSMGNLRPSHQTAFPTVQGTPNDLRRSMGNLRPSHQTAFPAAQGSPPPYSYRQRRSGNSYNCQPYFPAYNYGYQYYPYGWRYYAYPSWYVQRYWWYGY